jgi:hypothetical protein
MTIFDNGNCQDTLYSRALEYRLDEVNKVATLVWQYRNTPDTYGRATGNAQRHASGGMLINWGFGARVTEIHPDDTKALELHFGEIGPLTYRALRFPWRTSRFVTSTEALDFGDVGVGDSASLDVTLRNDWDRDVTITQFLSSNPKFSVAQGVPLTLTIPTPQQTSPGFSTCVR